MPKKSSRPALSRERIVELALHIVSEKGLDGLSMRGLATALGVEPMSLYYWFKGRDHLLDALLDEFLGGVTVPTSGSSVCRLQGAARQFRAACRRHPALVPYVVVHRFNTRVGLALLEELLGVVALMQPEPSARAAAFRMYSHWLIGFCLDEAAGFSRGPSAQEPPSDAEVAERFPRVVELGPFNREEHFDALFEYGLRQIVIAMGGADTVES